MPESKSHNLSNWLILVVIALALWGYYENTQKTYLRWEVEIYQERLKKYESPSIVNRIIDSTYSDYADEMRREDMANR
jgi:hypothetical protein